MSGGDRGKRRTRRLTEDERALWDFAARTMTRLERQKGRVHPAAPEDAEGGPQADVVWPPVGVSRPDAPPSGRAVRDQAEVAKPVLRPPPVLPAYVPPVSTPKASKQPPALSSFDIKSARRIRGGRTEIDARLDLHGMRQDEARSALVSFLRSSQAKGHRYVLIITGKGAPRRSAGDADDWRWSPERPDPPGVLRRNVPVWLASPDLRSLVVSYTEAAIQHGGSGALYVQVRVRG